MLWRRSVCIKSLLVGFWCNSPNLCYTSMCENFVKLPSLLGIIYYCYFGCRDLVAWLSKAFSSLIAQYTVFLVSVPIRLSYNLLYILWFWYFKAIFCTCLANNYFSESLIFVGRAILMMINLSPAPLDVVSHLAGAVREQLCNTKESPCDSWLL